MAVQGHSPLEQFEIHRLVPIEVGGFDMSFTNSSLFMIIVVVLITAFLTLSMSGRAMVPGRWQSMAELSYEFIASLLRDSVGNGGRRYFPFIFTLFMFLLFCNLMGMVPYTFTVTSHIIVTFALALVVFIGINVIGFARHGLGFLNLFVPAGVPKAFLLILVPVEVLSHFVKPVSLSVRLFANMMAGHTMLKVFAGFIIALGSIGGVLGPALAFPTLVFVIALTGLEVGIAILQAYVFTVLTCIYLNDAVNMHH